ncbi:MAG: lamin tail domain-containing protein [Ferruginibacter sp.]
MIRIPALFLGIVCYANVAVAQTPARYDIVINEIMADPSPQVGLPNHEWIELYNRSATAISLTGWRITDAGSQSGPMPVYTLQPGSYVIVCASGSATAMNVYGPVIAVTSFPSLDNAGDIISIKSAQNTIIHSVSYTDSWYRNELKKEGGWTLEMMDSNNPCSGYSNWTASNDNRGGTPGTKNAAAAQNPDDTAPKLLRAFATDSLNITLVFDEPLDSSSAVNPSIYNISDGIGMPASVNVAAPAFDKVNLRLNNALLRKKIYMVTVDAAADCMGNRSGSQMARAGLSEQAGSNDIIVNEILFNPKANGTDYVEIYNRSNNIADLKQIYIANRNSTGVISNIKQVSAENYLLFPQEFMVLTEDLLAIKKDFITKNPDAFITIASMPSFNDDEGDVILLNAQGAITDELQYNQNWHFSLLSNTEGIALERIDYNVATQLKDNWHSAAASAGYGTPGYKNSQYRTSDQPKGEITVSPEIISPDNDGRDDFATVSYRFPSPGYVASITVFDAAGRPVRYLQRNALCGITGNFVWDGLGEKKQALPAGIYIIYTSIFNTAGKKKAFKNTIVVAK